MAGALTWLCAEGPALANQGFQVLSPAPVAAGTAGFRVLAGAPPPVPAARPQVAAPPVAAPAPPLPAVQPIFESPPVAMSQPRPESPRTTAQPRAARRPAVEVTAAKAPPLTNPVADAEPPVRQAALNPAALAPKAETGVRGEPPQVKVPPPPADISPEWVERIIREAAGPALPELDVASFNLGGALFRPHTARISEALSGLTMPLLRDTEISLPEGRQQARNSLRKFLGKAKQPPPGTHSYAVKIMLRHEGRQERLWVGDLEIPPQRKPKPNPKLHGHLLNLPEVIRELNFGDRVAFEQDDIEDWTYIDQDGRYAGNFTGCALVAAKGDEAFVSFIERHRLDCRWLSIIQPVAN
ncbi:MAG: DUF2314 domain-containing protein [Methylocystis sp.]|nr:DUF2314 domain-containing protein [Methylocystis sp.]MCA3584918.1 DUF2314 domain-containing protein [Methylocystis sp.]MCA3591136.1 DUF2314 domain-containing protein [Methylocystis sp.]